MPLHSASELLDKKAGDEFTIQLLTAFEDKERTWILQDLGLDKESAADAEKYFKLVIVKVGLLEKAELDGDLFKKLYPGKTIESEDSIPGRREERYGGTMESTDQQQSSAYVISRVAR